MDEEKFDQLTNQLPASSAASLRVLSLDEASPAAPATVAPSQSPAPSTPAQAPAEIPALFVFIVIGLIVLISLLVVGLALWQ
jgi:hypothetical protein